MNTRAIISSKVPFRIFKGFVGNYFGIIDRSMFGRDHEGTFSKIDNELSFNSIHDHENSGVEYNVWHVPVRLFFDPYDRELKDGKPF